MRRFLDIATFGLLSTLSEVLGTVLFFLVLGAASFGLGNENRWIHLTTVTLLVLLPMAACAWIAVRLLRRTPPGARAEAAPADTGATRVGVGVLRGGLLLVCLFLFAALGAALLYSSGFLP